MGGGDLTVLLVQGGRSHRAFHTEGAISPCFSYRGGDLTVLFIQGGRSHHAFHTGGGRSHHAFHTGGDDLAVLFMQGGRRKWCLRAERVLHIAML